LDGPARVPTLSAAFLAGSACLFRFLDDPF